MIANKVCSTVLLMLSTVAAIGYCYSQPIITFGAGHPWDADVYYAMAEQFAAHTPLRGDKPFIYRLGTPFLIGTFFSNQLLRGYFWVNSFFAVGSILLTYGLLRQTLKNSAVVAILVLMLIINPNGPVRFTSFFPAFTDASAIFFILAIFAVAQSTLSVRVINFTIIGLSILGVFFREIVLFAPLSLLFAALYKRYYLDLNITNAAILALCCAMLFAGLAFIFTRSLVDATGDYTYLSHAVDTISRHRAYPDILITAYFMAYGPILLVGLLDLKLSCKVMAEYPHLCCYTLLILLMTLLGGWHTDRFALWGFPAYFVVIGRVLEKYLSIFRFDIKNCLFYVVIVIAQLFAFRVFNALPSSSFDLLNNIGHPGMPQTIIFSSYGENVNIAQLYAAYMSIEQRSVVLVQYVYCLIFLNLINPLQSE